MTRRFHKFWFIVLIFLSGCSAYKESFDCPMGSGTNCRSISQLDKMVENGSLANSNASTPSNPLAFGCHKMAHSCAQSCTVSPSYKFHTVARIPEQHLRIWIAGFHDTQGNFHDENVIYTILRPGQWVKRG